MMNDKELAGLEDPENWDYEHAERRPGRKQARAVVSVAFAREDFERVSEGAQRLGQRTSEFIRVAALRRADSLTSRATLLSSSGSYGLVLFADKPAPTTRVLATVVSRPELVSTN